MTWMLFLIALTSAFSQSIGSPATNPQQTKARSHTGISTDGLAGLNGTQKFQVLKLVEGMGVPITSIQGKKWPRRKDTYLAFGGDTTETDEHFRYRLFAFDLSGPEIHLLASNDKPYKLSRRDTLKGFDFAAYKLKPDEFAFGLRYARYRSYAGGGAGLEGLLIYRIQGKGFQEVLNVTTSFESDLAGEWNEDGTRDHKGNLGRAVVVITTRKTDGYFDWIKKADNGKSAPLIWDGSGYVMQGEDPFPTDDLDIFEAE